MIVRRATIPQVVPVVLPLFRLGEARRLAFFCPGGIFRTVVRLLIELGFPMRFSLPRSAPRSFVFGSLALAVSWAAAVTVPAADALTVSPVRLEITIEPGGVYRGEVVIRNEQSSEKTFYSSFENFEARGESGTPYFVAGKDGLAGWMSGAPESITLQAGERRVVPFQVSVPASAQPGGYFAAILWNDAPPAPSQGGQMAIGAKVGSLVLLRVAGDVPEEGGITEFSVADQRTVFVSLPVAFSWRFQNAGGDRVKPEGTVTITNLFGGRSAELPANPTKGNILPGSVRRFDVVWQESGSGSVLPSGFFSAAAYQAAHWRFGRYRAELALSYGNTGQQGVAATVFYVFPWQLLTLLALGLLVLALVVRFVLGSYRRRILAQAGLLVDAPERRAAVPAKPRSAPRTAPARPSPANKAKPARSPRGKRPPA